MVFWIQSDVNILNTVVLDTVELASDSIQQLKQKLKLKQKQRLRKYVYPFTPPHDPSL